MITGELRSKVDRLWNASWSGGMSNPLTVIEQFSYLIFIRSLDLAQIRQETQARRSGKPLAKPVFSDEHTHLRWSQFRQLGDPLRMFEIVRDQVFPFIRTLSADKSAYGPYLKDATLMISTPNLLQKLVDGIEDIYQDEQMQRQDVKGDLYEYLLSKLQTSGQNGQFRTPRHIIEMIVELMAPRPDDIVCDPSCGTSGFLVKTIEYLHKHHPELEHSEEQKKHFHNEMFYGYDFDPTMLRIAAMNLMLHGIESPHIVAVDSLSRDNEDLNEAFTLVLANPPFKGSLDEDQVAKGLLSMVKTKKTELLFLALILRSLKIGGRAAVIVPDGVLFGSSKAHLDIRKEIVENHHLQAVISMPAGVFKPYAGVSTGILLFTKTQLGGTDQVWFYDMQADGLSLDDKRNPLGEKQADGTYLTQHDDNNLPDLLQRWATRESPAEKARTRQDQSFWVSKAEIVANKYDLSLNRYKEVVHADVKHRSPKEILKDLKVLEDQILNGLNLLDTVFIS